MEPRTDEPEGMTPNEIRRRWPANVAYIEAEARAAALDEARAAVEGVVPGYPNHPGYGIGEKSLAAIDALREGAIRE